MIGPICPACGTYLEDRQCKLVCPECHYTEGCSDIFEYPDERYIVGMDEEEK